VYNDVPVKVGINASFFETGFLGLGKFANVTIYGVCVFICWSSIAYRGRGKGFDLQKTTATLGAIAMLDD
jgi:hypothetical protein